MVFPIKTDQLCSREYGADPTGIVQWCRIVVNFRSNPLPSRGISPRSTICPHA
jgi:hypothetical protein